jgi:proteasome lid subunit RPN8/RPN11
MDRGLADEVLETVKNAHPRSILLLLRGSRERDGEERVLSIEDYLIPPVGLQMQYGPWYATDFTPFLLHGDSRLLGEARSKPNGETYPSQEDLSRMTGGVLILLSSPYSLGDVYAYDFEGASVPLTIDPDSPLTKRE